MVYEIRARTLGAGRAEVDAGSETIPFDASWEDGPIGLPGPAELLASAFAACLLKNVERASKLLPFRYVGAEVDVVAAPPRCTTEVCRDHLRTASRDRRTRAPRGAAPPQPARIRHRVQHPRGRVRRRWSRRSYRACRSLALSIDETLAPAHGFQAAGIGMPSEAISATTRPADRCRGSRGHLRDAAIRRPSGTVRRCARGGTTPRGARRAVPFEARQRAETLSSEPLDEQLEMPRDPGSGHEPVERIGDEPFHGLGFRTCRRSRSRDRPATTATSTLSASSCRSQAQIRNPGIPCQHPWRGKPSTWRNGDSCD